MLNFYDEWEEEIKLAFVVIVLLAGVLFGALKVYEVTCYQTYGDMGYSVSWDWIAGCKLEVEEGKWIPAGSFYYKDE